LFRGFSVGEPEKRSIDFVLICFVTEEFRRIASFVEGKVGEVAEQ